MGTTYSAATAQSLFANFTKKLTMYATDPQTTLTALLPTQLSQG